MSNSNKGEPRANVPKADIPAASRPIDSLVLPEPTRHQDFVASVRRNLRDYLHFAPYGMSALLLQAYDQGLLSVLVMYGMWRRRDVEKWISERRKAFAAWEKGETKALPPAEDINQMGEE